MYCKKNIIFTIKMLFIIPKLYFCRHRKENNAGNHKIRAGKIFENLIVLLNSISPSGGDVISSW